MLWLFDFRSLIIKKSMHSSFPRKRFSFAKNFLSGRFSLEKILYREDFNFFGKDFNFFQENFNFFWEDFLSRIDLSFLLFAKAKLRTSYAGALLSFMNILISFEKISISFKKILISLEKIFQICFLPKQNWGHVMPQPLLSSSCLLLRKIAVL